MKKLVALLLVLLFVGTVCLADSIDLSVYSVDELNALKEQIDAELSSRGATSDFVPWKDFCAGRYLPDPSSVLGKDASSDYGIKVNKDDRFNETFIVETEDEFFKYCEECVLAGFMNVSEMSPIMFEASTSDGKELSITHFTEKCQVSLKIG